jgi:hypothetical protein
LRRAELQQMREENERKDKLHYEEMQQMFEMMKHDAEKRDRAWQIEREAEEERWEQEVQMRRVVR